MDGAPLDRPEFERWMEESDRALAGARREGQAGAHNWSCFLAEQSAQFAIKALLHGLGLAPWGHDLDELGASVVGAGIAVPPDVLEALTRLGRHYIASRYPDAHASGPAAAHYTGADAAQAIADAEAVRATVGSAWEGLDG